MTDPRNLTHEYLRRQIENATPAQQLVLLYDGAIKFVLRAREAIGQGDIEGRYKANRRAMEIVGYLLEILDMEKGGEVAARLQRIYTFVLKKLMEVDFKNDTASCDEVVEHLRTLRASWYQLAERNAMQTAVPAAAPAASQDEAVPVRRSAVA
ncbi:MAG: flagellar export chaperone FliS [Proteobacteria bacterium]|nr:flagellar export chaperone FliS [Pseudomonadota bacterium]